MRDLEAVVDAAGFERFALLGVSQGAAIGVVYAARLRRDSQVDPLIVLTVLTWAVYGAFLVLRYGAGWHGRRAGYTTLAGFARGVALPLSLDTGHSA